MSFVKYSIASVVAACATVVACGGSSSVDGSSGAGTGSTSAGTTGDSSSSAGSSSNAGSTAQGGSSSGGTVSNVGGAPTGAGGTLTNAGAAGAPLNAAGAGGVSCTALLAAVSAACPATATCAEMSCMSEIAACDQTSVEACIANHCFAQALACLNAGTGGAGGGAGTTKTCADLDTCCATLTGTAMQACTLAVAQKNDADCGLVYGQLCN